MRPSSGDSIFNAPGGGGKINSAEHSALIISRGEDVIPTYDHVLQPTLVRGSVHVGCRPAGGRGTRAAGFIRPSGGFARLYSADTDAACDMINQLIATTATRIAGSSLTPPGHVNVASPRHRRPSLVTSIGVICEPGRPPARKRRKQSFLRERRAFDRPELTSSTYNYYFRLTFRAAERGPAVDGTGAIVVVGIDVEVHYHRQLSLRCGNVIRLEEIDRRRFYPRLSLVTLKRTPTNPPGETAPTL